MKSSDFSRLRRDGGIYPNKSESLALIWSKNFTICKDSRIIRPVACVQVYDRKAARGTQIQITCNCQHEHEGSLDCQYTLVKTFFAHGQDKLVPLTTTEFNQAVNQWSRDTIGRTVPYHQLRVTVSTYADLCQVSLENISKTLNHANQNTTRRYCRGSAGQAMRANLLLANKRKREPTTNELLQELLKEVKRQRV